MLRANRNKYALRKIPARVSAIAALAFVCLAAQSSAEEDMRSLLQNASSAKTSAQRAQVITEIKNHPPKTEDEVEALANTIRNEPSTDLEEAALQSMMNVSPDSIELRGKYASLLDDKSDKVQIAAMNGCARLGNKDSATKILTMLKKRDRYNLFERTGIQKPSVESIAYAGAASDALASLGYQPALEEVLSRPEVMSFPSGGGTVVAKFGAAGLSKLVEVANAKDQRRRTALAGIERIQDRAAIPQLAELVKGSDTQLATMAANALGSMRQVTGSDEELSEAALKASLASQDENLRSAAYSALLMLNPQKNLQNAMPAIKKESGTVQLHIFYALMRHPVPEAVPALEQFIHDDEKQNPNVTMYRGAAAQAIFKATGRRVPYRGVETDRKLHSDPYDPDKIR